MTLKWRKILKWVSIILMVLLAGSFLFSRYIQHKLNQVPKMTVQEVIDFSTKDKPEAVITIGTLIDGEISYKVYGENGQLLEPVLYQYEIGSLTKTITASMILKAANEGKLSLSESIDQYFSLPTMNKYPTIKSILSHTSGLKAYYFEKPMIQNFLKGSNDFYGINQKMVLERLKRFQFLMQNKSLNIQTLDMPF